MADHPSTESFDHLASVQYHQTSERTAWRGGPRLPITGVSRRGNVIQDDLDAVPSTSVPLADRLFDIAMRGFLGDRSAIQPNLPDRASRRRALSPDTEQRWQHVLELHQPRLPHLYPPSEPASAGDSRRSFFGPREPLRRPRASPLTPYTPYTPFTPDSPELETPDDDVPGMRAQNQKSADSDSEDGSFDALDLKITPFPLWEFPHSPNSASGDTGTSEGRDPTDYVTNDGYLSYESLLPSAARDHQEGIPPRRWRVVNALPQDVESSSDSHKTSSSPPTPSQSEFPPTASPAQSLRPRLSIVTQISRGRSATFSRGAQAVPPPVPSPSSATPDIPGERPDITTQLMQKLTTDILRDERQYKALLAHRGDEAQEILDCLQVVLDHPSLRGPDRAIILKALTRLSTASGLYPRCFRLDNVQMLGNEPDDEGRYGSVWKASSHNQVVCVKILRTYQRMPTQPLLKMLSHEALLWGQLTHPNILPFYGIHINEVRRSRFGLVSPWMENGNIVNYLKQNPNVLRVPLVYDIASGLQYLHGLNIVHGDIKGTNILVTSTGHACLADFGLSSLLGDNILVWPSLGSGPGPSGGTPRWKAPELFLLESMDQDSAPTRPSDVYSFACAAYEVFTGLLPFHEIRGAEALTVKLVNSRVQPSRPPPEKLGPAVEELTDEAWRFLENCWNHEPAERLTVEEALERLERMMTAEQIKSVKGRVDDSEWGSRLSSSCFRMSVKPSDKPSDAQLLKVMSIISA